MELNYIIKCSFSPSMESIYFYQILNIQLFLNNIPYNDIKNFQIFLNSFDYFAVETFLWFYGAPFICFRFEFSHINLTFIMKCHCNFSHGSPTMVLGHNMLSRYLVSHILYILLLRRLVTFFVLYLHFYICRVSLILA